jgi:HAMP domain-containing protein
MSVTIELPPQIEAALASHARAANMATDRYVAAIVERAVEIQQRRAVERLADHVNSMSSQMPADTTPAEMDAALDEALEHVRPLRRWER